MTTRINVGLMGCGRIARLVHMNTLKGMRGVRLLAVSDADEKCRDDAGRAAPGAKIFSDYRELLGYKDIDAVIICLPNSLHAEAAAEAFREGKHVYLEKPLARNTEEGERVIKTWKKSGMKGMIGFNLRFNPLYQALKNRIRSGIIGNINCVRTVFTSASRSLPEWKRSRESGGGVPLDLASHHADLVRYLLDTEIAEVYGRIESRVSEHDNASVSMRTKNGLDVQSYFSLNSIDEDKIEIYGTLGKLTADRYHSLNVELVSSESHEHGRIGRLKDYLSSIPASPVLKDRILGTGREPSFERALGHFASSILEGAPTSPDLADGFASLCAIEAVEESARTGRTVSLRDQSVAGGKE